MVQASISHNEDTDGIGMFKKLCGTSMECDAYQLQRILNHKECILYKEKFDVPLCKSIVALFDVSVI